MITQKQFDAIDVCADDSELFYFIFAELNFGGQVFARDQAPESMRGIQIKMPAEKVCDEIKELIEKGFLECFSSEGSVTRKVDVDEIDFSVYHDYHCITIDEHINRFGYGPHVFEATDRGREATEDFYQKAANQ